MVSTANSYAAFKDRLDRIFNQEKKRISGFCGYTSDDVAARLMQRYAETCVFEFTRICADVYQNTGKLPSDEDTFDCGGLIMHSENKISVMNKRFITLLANFLAVWARTFLTILFSLKFHRVKDNSSLLFGVGRQDLLAEGNDKRFLDFARSGHLTPLVLAQCLIVESEPSIQSVDPIRVKYGHYPLLLALSWGGLGWRSWIYALAQHLRTVFSFGTAVFYSPNLILLGRDAANHAAAAGLNHQSSLDSVVITNSNYFSQPLWMWALPGRHYVCHLVWYSQNNYPLTYVDEMLAVPIPNLAYVRADIQWVWSDGFKNFLTTVCPQCTYYVVAPIVWHRPSNRVKNSKRDLRIALFDVTPISASIERKLGLLRNFYNEENISNFIKDAIEAARKVGFICGTKIEVVLKHKRNHQTHFHSSKYIETISAYEDSGLIRIIEPEANLYDFISDCDIIVATPYSSPVYLGRDAGKVAFWYDPTETLDWKLGPLEFLLVKGKERLVAEILKVFV